MNLIAITLYNLEESSLKKDLKMNLDNISSQSLINLKIYVSELIGSGILLWATSLSGFSGEEKWNLSLMPVLWVCSLVFCIACMWRLLRIVETIFKDEKHL